MVKDEEGFVAAVGWRPVHITMAAEYRDTIDKTPQQEFYISI